MPPFFFFVVGLFFSSLFIVFSSSEVKLLPWLSVALDHVVEVVRGGWSPESAWTGNLHSQSGPGLWKDPMLGLIFFAVVILKFLKILTMELPSPFALLHNGVAGHGSDIVVREVGEA